MTLTQNLARAEMAVKFVERFLRGRASNRPEDIVHTLQQTLNRDAQRFGDDDIAQEFVLSSLNAVNIGQQSRGIYMQRVTAINDARAARNARGTRLNAAAIIQDGIGNCFEHAVLACHFLNQKGVPSYMVDTDDETNHCFVVIGVPPGLDQQQIQVAPNAAPQAPLGNGVSVVCDAWYHEWFGIQQHWATKMHRILMTTNKRQTGTLPPAIPLTFTAGSRVT